MKAKTFKVMNALVYPGYQNHHNFLQATDIAVGFQEADEYDRRADFLKPNFKVFESHKMIGKEVLMLGYPESANGRPH